ncbi:triphosphoribosyl-dephospho-CoA synthase CitG [Anaeromicropila herbilytica]|uniref:Probable 2-(5''-triphosphoribosyl)-3'-dephosphocoenzyme-A synthase n=1 Tax=Anaeromicropila herbilytica TaxID=2785025 RepID=A0A7R7EQ39_9FIRM|nr:triphosphoribosyl-dephospho-CoA synthase CitG [Anaeromicropila herbilytica]BCN32660.1 triphosphoribosyl-dephospho-CoA synthase [Anaeromicropila herbilytica]
MKKENTILLNEISLTISSYAMQAMLYEVSCAPSPGLVSPVSNGAHKDMDYFTFIDSSVVLSKYFALFVQEGYSNKSCKEIFRSIRAIGIMAEEEMFINTKGVNTHKGMLFLMGIACAATGKALYDNQSFSDIQSIIKEMTKGIVDKELLPLRESLNLSHGEKLFLKYKNEGVRGEVEKGMPTVFDYALEFYKENMELSLNNRLVNTLIKIMAICNDTTILHRHNPQTLEEVKQKAQDILSIGGMRSYQGREKINELSTEFIERNISPGGSADLLAITVFFYFVEKHMS